MWRSPLRGAIAAGFVLRSWKIDQVALRRGRRRGRRGERPDPQTCNGEELFLFETGPCLTLLVGCLRRFICVSVMMDGERAFIPPQLYAFQPLKSAHEIQK